MLSFTVLLALPPAELLVSLQGGLEERLALVGLTGRIWNNISQTLCEGPWARECSRIESVGSTLTPTLSKNLLHLNSLNNSQRKSFIQGTTIHIFWEEYSGKHF